MRQLALNNNQTIAFDLPIFQDSIDGEFIHTINARDLHRELEVGRDFSTWIKERIAKFGFTEGVDFCSPYPVSENIGTDFSPNSGKTINGRPTKEYHISFDMAKELAMVEANDKGQQIRRYFIQKEKEARLLPPASNQLLAPLLQDCVSVAQIFGLSGNQALLSASNGVERLTGHNPATLLGVELTSDRKEKTFTVTELGTEFFDGMSARKLNVLFAEAGLQEKIGKHWELTEAGKAHAELLDTGKAHSNGTPVKQIKWFSSATHAVESLS